MLERLVREDGEHPQKSTRGIVGTSAAIASVRALIAKVGPQDKVRVLIRGETGTGKELVAQALHESSPRRKKPFVAVNCATLGAVLENELFGNVPGGFTGAIGQAGLFEQADGGTLFLDEIAEASPTVQAALLRTLESGEVRRVGSETTVRVDVRVVAATHVDLASAVAGGRFREDLFYRLSGITITVPPLRRRREDVPLLVEHFCRVDQVARPSAKVMTEFVGRDWPGNVRELRSALRRLAVTGDADPPRRKKTRRVAVAAPVVHESPKVLTMRESERRTLIAALAAADGEKKLAAKLLGVSRRQIFYLIQRHKLT
jgi:transcriptional regulator with GAF, ATPase, and Fis domain